METSLEQAMPASGQVNTTSLLLVSHSAPHGPQGHGRERLRPHGHRRGNRPALCGADMKPGRQVGPKAPRKPMDGLRPSIQREMFPETI